MNDVTMSKICKLKDMDISKRLLPDSIQYNKSNFSHENELVLKNFSCPLVSSLYDIVTSSTCIKCADCK